MAPGRRRKEGIAQKKIEATVTGSLDSDNKMPSKSGGRWHAVVAGMLIMVGKRVVDAIMGPQTFISCTPDQPLYTTSRDFLPKVVFSSMQAEVKDHPYMGGNALNVENFKKTKGFVVKFNREGVDRLKQDSALSALADYFDRARDPFANAWVLNVLVCLPQDLKAEDGAGMPLKLSEPPLSVSPHIDETLGTSSRDAFMAHVVNVLYVSVPEGMAGGRLEMYGYSWLREKLFPYLLSFLSTRQLDSILPPDAGIDPTENTLVSFRGDTIHRVQGFRVRDVGDVSGTVDNHYRLSVVLEQYRVPLLSYSLTTEYALSAGSLHDEERSKERGDGEDSSRTSSRHDHPEKY